MLGNVPLGEFIVIEINFVVYT